MGSHQEDEVITSLRILGIQERWDEVWNVSHALGIEISWIQDAEGTVFVDLGSSGEVRLSAPIGAVLPFRLWIHTHPWTAYWSFTDRTALRNFAGLIEVAIVLGHDHWKRSSCQLRMGETLPDGVEETHVSLFDGSNCGIKMSDRPVFSVQHHPEASPGPQDSFYLFHQFVASME